LHFHYKEVSLKLFGLSPIFLSYIVCYNQIMPTLYLIRHGANSYVGKRLAGRLAGVHLNAEGLAQAETLAAYLAPIAFTAIYSSPLDRALETAAPLALAKNLPVQIHPSLLEVDFGRWQGLTLRFLKRLPLWKELHDNPGSFRFPGGESPAEAQARTVDAIEDIAGGLGEKEIAAVFSHSDSIRLATAHYAQMPLKSFHSLTVDLVSITIISLGKHPPRLRCINQKVIPPHPPAV
jgi:broad specificity phosphatase PhoE